MHPDSPPKLTSFNVISELQHLSVEELREIAKSRQLPYAVALANITGDLNTGVIIRSACVLGAQRVFIFGKKKYDRRSTVGAHNYIELMHFESHTETEPFIWSESLQIIRVNGYTPVLIEQGGAPLFDFAPSQSASPVCLVFGAEDTGIPRDVCQSELCYTIPQPGVLRSLNVSTAASIAMWHTMMELTRAVDV
jgi:tRNA (guanosine-2'-O-)-methyltransferase